MKIHNILMQLPNEYHVEYDVMLKVKGLKETTHLYIFGCKSYRSLISE